MKLGIASLLLFLGTALVVDAGTLDGGDGKGKKGKGKKGKKVKRKGGKGGSRSFFNRIASFPVCSQIEENCNTDEETAAEIVAASGDGYTLVYTDSPQGKVGFVDISHPSYPVGLGTMDVFGEPTSVAVCGDYAIVVVNTSEDFVNTSGVWHVIMISEMMMVRTNVDLGGQPDAIAVSPDCSTAAVAIENERDEDLGNGSPPQMPAGSVVVFDISSGDPEMWTTSSVDVTGLPGVKFPEDPEPEFVSINDDHIAVVTMQENNALVLIDTKTATVLSSFSAGEVDLDGVDIEEDGLISQTESLAGVPREPDGVAWIGNDYFATADEGDLDGGSRGFTIFDTSGNIVYTSGNSMDQLTARLGHYPDERSENKGNEPENIAYGIYNGRPLLFVNSERSSLVFVYDVEYPSHPELIQILPAGAGPEGGFPVPSRGLLVVASEVDDRGDKPRSVINIYSNGFKSPVYPTIYSGDRANGSPIPFAALSGLGGCGGKGKGGKGKRSMKPYCDSNILYTIEDSFFKKNRIMAIDVSHRPAKLVKEYRISDANGLFKAALSTTDLDEDLQADLVNDDNTVNIDPEGIDIAYDGGFWLAHEGSGTVGDEDRPVESPNVLFKLDGDAVIEKVILLPDDLNAVQFRFGFEGVAEWEEYVIVAFQRAWNDEAHPRIGIYNFKKGEWRFLFYPLDEPESQNGGWVGLSDITSVGGGYFLVLERDNQGGPDAAVKRIYKIHLGDVDENNVLTKYLHVDLFPILAKATNGPIPEKVEGMAIDGHGRLWINNDNDGVDDNSGENLMLRIH